MPPTPAWPAGEPAGADTNTFKVTREKNVTVILGVSPKSSLQLQKSTALRRMHPFKTLGTLCLAVRTKSKRNREPWRKEGRWGSFLAAPSHSFTHFP